MENINGKERRRARRVKEMLGWPIVVTSGEGTTRHRQRWIAVRGSTGYWELNKRIKVRPWTGNEGPGEVVWDRDGVRLAAVRCLVPAAGRTTIVCQMQLTSPCLWPDDGNAPRSPLAPFVLPHSPPSSHSEALLF